jgi:hypothetical protein
LYLRYRRLAAPVFHRSFRRSGELSFSLKRFLLFS